MSEDVQEFDIHLGDTRTVLSVTLKQKNESGVETVVDVSSGTVTFKMVDIAGTEVISSGSVTSDDAANGQVSYDFQDADVDEPGTYYGYFVYTVSGETDHFPVKGRKLQINIHGDS